MGRESEEESGRRRARRGRKVQGLHSFERLRVGDDAILSASAVLEEGVLRTDTRIVKACGDTATEVRAR